jgi:hypothetical protein
VPWVRVLGLIGSITSTTWGHETWPEVKPLPPRAGEEGRHRGDGGSVDDAFLIARAVCGSTKS